MSRSAEGLISDPLAQNPATSLYALACSTGEARLVTAQPDAVRSALLQATRAVLRPLVRLLIAHGVTYPAFGRLAKEVYIDVGTRHFTLAFKKQTDSRVALVTGITRKEIGQI